MHDKLIRLGFHIAGLVNIIGILVITRGMTSDTLANADPAVFSQFGILIIILWGLAYIATAPFATTAVLLPVVFALEKLAYTVNWVIWMGSHSGDVTNIQEGDFLGGLFLGAYGLNDGLFFLFFAAVAFRNWRNRAAVQRADPTCAQGSGDRRTRSHHATSRPETHLRRLLRRCA